MTGFAVLGLPLPAKPSDASKPVFFFRSEPIFLERNGLFVNTGRREAAPPEMPTQGTSPLCTDPSRNVRMVTCCTGATGRDRGDHGDSLTRAGLCCHAGSGPPICFIDPRKLYDGPVQH